LAGIVRAALERADYTADGVLEAITPAGQAGLQRNQSLAALRALAERTDPLATLIRLFILQQPQPAAAVVAAGLGELIGSGLLEPETGRSTPAVGSSEPTGSLGVGTGSAAAEVGLLEREAGPAPAAGTIRALVDIRPYADEPAGVAGWVVSDQTATLNTARGRPRPDHVLGISPASVSLSQITPRRPVGRALDLGTGSGVQCLSLARLAARVVATDLNPRALALARWTFALNGMAVDARLGSLYQPVAGETFDLIVTNPPFVIAPPRRGRLLYRETSLPADDAMKTVVAQAGAHLNQGGSLHVVGNWAEVAGQSWTQRLASWVPPGCDAFVVQRERLDVCEYIEVWLADAGLAGSSAYLPRYREWLAYFDRLGVEAVGLGWITLVKSGSARPARVSCLDWPAAVTQPVADDLMAHLAAFEVAELSDDAILDTRWRLADGTVQQALSQPGLPEPYQVRLARGDGLRRVVQVDTALGGVIGACDGELSLRQIIGGVAAILGAAGSSDSAADLTSRLLPQIRQLIAETWLTALR